MSKEIEVMQMSELKAYGIRVIDGLVVESESGQLYLKSEADKVIAHHKYKRCLAMADWCKSEYVHRKSLSDKEQWYWRRWYNKWLELAEKFKEVK